MPKKVVIVGGSEAGKTFFIGALQTAVTNRDPNAIQDRNIRILPRTETLRDLWDRFRTIICRLPEKHPGEIIKATRRGEETEYRFDFEFTKSTWPWKQKKVVEFSLVDGPGGDIMMEIESLDLSVEFDRSRIKKYREMFVEHAASSDGMMICLDSTARGNKNAISYFVFFGSLLQEIHSAAGGRDLPFKRIAFVLTKADEYFFSVGAKRKAQHYATKEKNPWNRLAELLPAPVLNGLQSLCDDKVKFACCWSSVYGFIQNEGSANFNPATGGLRDAGKSPNQIDGWRPFSVLDPFDYLATGRVGSMAVINKAQLISRQW